MPALAGSNLCANQLCHWTAPRTSVIRSDNGPEFVAKAVRDWLGRVGVQTLFIEPGSPWENGYCESLNGKLRDELLNIEIFDTLREAQVLIEGWRRHYNAIRPHSSIGWKPPAPEAIAPPDQAAAAYATWGFRPRPPSSNAPQSVT